MKNEIIKILNIYLKKNNSYDFSNTNFNEIYKFSNDSGLAAIVSYTIVKYKLVDDKKFESILFYSIKKNEILNLYRNRIKEILEKNSINFLFLKGHTLSKYYDEDYLRYSDDIDIYVNLKDYKHVCNLLANKLNLKKYSFAENEATIANTNITIDVHCMITQNEIKVEEAFNNIDIKASNHELDINHKYLLSIHHMAKHVVANYIPLQCLIDIYYLSKLNIDNKFINEKLEIMGLKKFNDLTIKVINVLFQQEDSTPEINRYIDYLLNIANNRGIENKTLVGNAINGKINIIKRLFPNFDEMIRQYPILKKRKALLPYYYVKRLVERSAYGGYKRAKKEIDANINIDKEKVLETKKLLKDLGLYE